MPNWCENDLVMYGPAEVVEAIYNKSLIEGNGFDMLEAFLPTPEELLGNSAETDGVLTTSDNGWYNWRLDNWGTKWQMKGKAIPVERVYTLDEEDGNRTSMLMIQMNFDTAWSPPEPGIESIAKMFPDVHFFITYKEEGMGYQGFSYYYNGKVVATDYTESIIPSADAFWDNIDFWVETGKISTNEKENN